VRSGVDARVAVTSFRAKCLGPSIKPGIVFHLSNNRTREMQATRFKLQTLEFTCETMVRALPKYTALTPINKFRGKQFTKLRFRGFWRYIVWGILRYVFPIHAR